MYRKTSIREQNDAFRCHTAMAIARGIKGQIIITEGIANKSEQDQAMITDLVSMFGQCDALKFTEDNDPYGEHDFGAFDHAGEKIFWKIDYYNLDLTAGSDDPANPNTTKRVLTIMLASEY